MYLIISGHIVNPVNIFRKSLFYNGKVDLNASIRAVLARLESALCAIKEIESGTYGWDRLATGRRQPSLHMDVRFLACPSHRYPGHSPSTQAHSKQGQNRSIGLPGSETKKGPPTGEPFRVGPQSGR